MKRGVVFILAMTLFLIQTNSQPINPVSSSLASLPLKPSASSTYEKNLYFLASENVDREEIILYQKELDEFVKKLASKRDKISNESYFLKHMFYKVHNKYLKFYDNFVTFNDLFKKGNYDCVSGTALYSLILDELGFSYYIYESNFHVLLLVQVGDNLILMESTDFREGFVDNQDEISKRIEYYQSLNETESDSYYNYQQNTHRAIDSRQLAGLLFYNLAVKEFNQQDFPGASTYLDKAELLYKGPRISELRNLITKMTLAANSVSLH